MSRLNLYARVRQMRNSWHTRPRVQRAPGFPCALCFERDKEIEKLGRKSRREIAKVCLLFENRSGSRSFFLLPLWEKVARVACRMRGWQLRAPPLRKQPLTRPRCYRIVSTLSHKGRGEGS